MIDMDLRRRVVAEALTWLKTPYHHQGSLKGVGVDCVWILIRTYQAVGILPLDFDPGDYAAEWYLHHHEEIYMGGVERYATRLPDNVPPLIGDVALFRYGKCVSHGAIIVGDDLMIHASRPDRQVELCELRTYADRLHSYWTPTVPEKPAPAPRSADERYADYWS